MKEDRFKHFNTYSDRELEIHCLKTYEIICLLFPFWECKEEFAEIRYCEGIERGRIYDKELNELK